jgi:DNA replication protein DnaC
MNIHIMHREGMSIRSIAASLGISRNAVRALQAGIRVYFLSAQELLDQVHAAQLEGLPGHKQRHLGNVPLLIIDELGYVQFDSGGDLDVPATLQTVRAPIDDHHE